MTRACKIVPRTIAVLAIALCAAWPQPASSQGTAKVVREVATVAAVVGGTELQRAAGGSWQLAVVGSALFTGDRVRTRPTSRLKLILQDGSVVDLGPASELVIKDQLFDTSAGKYRSTLSLVTGKIRSLVGEYYQKPGSRYEIETPTAVAGVRGTEFVVQYETSGDYTDVVGVEGKVLVEGRLGVVGGGVRVGPQEATRVQKGRFPSAPRRIDDALFRQYLEGLEIIGTGGRDSLASIHAAAQGTLLARDDSLAGEARRPARTVSGLVVGAPDEPAAYRGSLDVDTNTQPLMDYRIRPPGRPAGGTGTVRVEF